MLRSALDFKLMRSYLSLLQMHKVIVAAIFSQKTCTNLSCGILKFYENKNNAKSETSKNDGVYSYQKENRCNLKHTRFEDTTPLPK